MTYDLVVLGGGAGGMAAARAAARMHKRVALVQDGPVGGDCTFTGCVPSKTLIEAAEAGVAFEDAMKRISATVAEIAATESADVLRGEGIDVVEARGRFTGPRTVAADGRVLRAAKVVVATGAAPAVPPLAGLATVGHLTSETIWQLETRPSSVVVLGGGAIGCELAQALARYGIAVTMVEAMDRLLTKEEPEAGQVVRDALVRDGVDLRLGAKVTKVQRGSPGEVTVVLDDGSTVRAEHLLVAVGRTPVTDGLDLAAAGVRTDAHGNVVTDDRLATSADGVYAVGDVTGRLPFTHAADEMGRLAAANALRWPRRLRFHADLVPWVTFTSPEVARVGMREAEAAACGGQVAYLPMSAVDRAVAASRTEGFVKIIAGPRLVTRNIGGGKVLGATIVAPRAGEMVHEIAVAMRTRAFTARLAQTVHAYPTWSTAIRSAAAQFFVTLDGRRARPAVRDDQRDTAP